MTPYSATARCPVCGERSFRLETRSVSFGPRDRIEGDDWQIVECECDHGDCPLTDSMRDEADEQIADNREARIEARESARDAAADLELNLKREA